MPLLQLLLEPAKVQEAPKKRHKAAWTIICVAQAEISKGGHAKKASRGQANSESFVKLSAASCDGCLASHHSASHQLNLAIPFPSTHPFPQRRQAVAPLVSMSSHPRPKKTLAQMRAEKQQRERDLDQAAELINEVFYSYFACKEVVGKHVTTDSVR